MESMARFITHRMTLFSLAYCDWYREICKELGITEERILAKLHPKYKEKKEDGTEFGKDRCDRFMFWANHKRCNEEDHYQRLDMVKRYITLIYPRLVKESMREEAVEKFIDDLGPLVVNKNIPLLSGRNPELTHKVSVRIHRVKQKKENPNQMEFDFGEEFK